VLKVLDFASNRKEENLLIKRKAIDVSLYKELFAMNNDF
jgi:hypothetical protein